MSIGRQKRQGYLSSEDNYADVQLLFADNDDIIHGTNMPMNQTSISLCALKYLDSSGNQDY